MRKEDYIGAAKWLKDNKAEAQFCQETWAIVPATSFWKAT